MAGTNIASVDVIAQLETLQGGPVTAGSTVPALAIVQGHSAIDDGGGGIFKWIEAGLAGDHGTIFPVTAPGTGTWLRVHSGSLDVRWFGAKTSNGFDATAAANNVAFDAAMEAVTKGSTVFVPKGDFYFADSLHLRRSVILHGTGMNWQTTLHFPAGKSLVIDLVTNNPFPDTDNSQTVVRDLAVLSAENWTLASDPTVDTDTWAGRSIGTPGIRMAIFSMLENVLVEGFTGTGIEIEGDNVAGSGQTSTWRVRNCSVYNCGGHGLFAEGGDANTGLCLGLVVGNVGGCGVLDSSEGGGTYIGCYVQLGDKGGYSYHNAQGIEGDELAKGNNSTFFGCYSETTRPARLLAGATYIGGAVSENFTADSNVFASLGAGQVWPFQVHPPNPAGPSVRTFVGVDHQKPFGWTTAGYEDNIYWELRWRPEERVWALEAADSSGFRATYFTTRHGTIENPIEHPRGIGLQGFPRLLLGPAANPAQQNILIGVAEEKPTEPGQWGDRVYNTRPILGGPAGWIFAQNEEDATFSWRPFGVIS